MKYVLLTTFTNVFTSKYGFSLGTVGLVYLGLGVGFSTGALLNGIFNDRMANKRTKLNRGERLPEYRLPLMTRSILLTPVGLFMYGWTAQYHLHWILPIIGSTLLGVGLILIMVSFPSFNVMFYSLMPASRCRCTPI